MKRFLPVIVAFLMFAVSANASHIIGGEMRYEYVGPGVNPNSKIFRIVMILFKGSASGPGVANLDPTYVIGIYNNDNNQKFIGPAINNNWIITRIESNPLPPVPIIFPPCIQNPPSLNYTYATYTMTVELPNTSTGYTVVFQTCCRESGLKNVPNGIGATYSCSIPGTSQIGNGGDNCPAFTLPINVICKFSPFTLNFAATDADPGDSLVYSFCNAYDGGIAPGSPFEDPAPPPYNSVTYVPPYSGTNPLGASANINPQTGIISGIAPDTGKYVVCVCISVFRNGVLITTHRKDLIVEVSDCTTLDPQVKPNDKTCDGFTRSFQNSNPSPLIITYFWDFGVTGILSDTSNLPNPVYTYTDTGIYIVKLIVNKNLPCTDSSVSVIKVYPGFRPGFLDSGSCVTNPFKFFDATATDYGFVDSWSWNFGDLTTLADTSHLQNPQWTYSSAGTKDVTLIVTNSKGCIDTAVVNIDVLAQPLITLGFNDALICIPDSITLNASGAGNFSWTPNVRIINANTSTPTVFPVVDTWYVVNLDDNGCVNQDSVHIRVTTGVNLLARSDTTICLTDAVQLSATTNALTFLWTPAATLSNPNIANPIATPTAAVTTYQLRASIGTCFSDDDVTITAVPYPLAALGPNQTICYNTTAQLDASHNGNSFSWSPTAFLNNPNILNPVATPPRTITYYFTVFDNKGCPKPGRASIVITVNPKLRAYAGRDTIVVVGQPLFFNGSGGSSYLWSPPTGLTSTNIPNPVGVYGMNIDSVRYKLVVRDAAGCPDSAYVTVRVFKVKPTIFVPTAFTPNGDGLNDDVHPIAVGIKKINYFSIYNRWGELVFTTNEDRKGWDGRIGGKLQSSAVFVWMVSAIDYLGAPIFLKGTVALIR